MKTEIPSPTHSQLSAEIASDSPTSKDAHPEWWQQMLTRRSAAKSLAGLAAMAGIGSFVTACDEDEDEADRDVLEIQKAEGWNVGSSDKSLSFPNKQDSDSLHNSAWKDFTQPSALMKAWSPKEEAWKPFFVPTLIQSLSQPTLQSALVPVCSASMREAYSRGLGMRELLKTSTNAKESLIVVDIPGPEAVAFAAALADIAIPILTFDNWPHPLGVVPSHLTLAALVYFANEVAQKTAQRPEGATPVLILDSNRLTNYIDADNQFDNRYMAKLPGVENLSAKGITSILYATPSEQQKTELDDLNDDFALYQEKNISINMLPVSRFQSEPDMATVEGSQELMANSSAATLTRVQNPTKPMQQNSQQQDYQQQPQEQYANTSGSYVSHAPIYYYGGSFLHSPWFFYHYPAYTYYRTVPALTRLPATRYARPAYSAVRRPTIFSASRVGNAGSSGIGKQRPSGFGRVTVRTNSSTGRISGIRAGRSGSFSGSRSGSFGRSSFGGRSS